SAKRTRPGGLAVPHLARAELCAKGRANGGPPAPRRAPGPRSGGRTAVRPYAHRDAGNKWDNHAPEILDGPDCVPYYGVNSFDKANLRKRPTGVAGALDVSMYELLVLSLLMHWPLHAYRIAKISNDIVGPEERISTGTLSTLIGKLTHAGLITPA